MAAGTLGRMCVLRRLSAAAAARHQSLPESRARAKRSKSSSVTLSEGGVVYMQRSESIAFPAAVGAGSGALLRGTKPRDPALSPSIVVAVCLYCVASLRLRGLLAPLRPAAVGSAARQASAAGACGRLAAAARCDYASTAARGAAACSRGSGERPGMAVNCWMLRTAPGRVWRTVEGRVTVLAVAGAKRGGLATDRTFNFEFFSQLLPAQQVGAALPHRLYAARTLASLRPPSVQSPSPKSRPNHPCTAPATACQPPAQPNPPSALFTSERPHPSSQNISCLACDEISCLACDERSAAAASHAVVPEAAVGS